ncbi:MAG: DUF721 domain-containing protein [Deltaproteobacteria bacterium]|nr:DUF721 domain-containing protein [Deltaproteobacteria bacterium]
MPRQTSKDLSFVSAGDALLAALGKTGLSDQARRLMISQIWTKAVGKQTARHTEPDGFSRGVLRVKASSAAWQNELTFLKAEIINRLNDVLGKKIVREIRVVAGSVRRLSEVRKPPWLNQLSTAKEQEIADANSLPIKDDEVRASFEHLMCLHLKASRYLNTSEHGKKRHSKF